MTTTASNLPNKIRLLSILLLIIISFLTIVLSLEAATLSSVKSQTNNNDVNGPMPTTTAPSTTAKTFPDTVSSTQLMSHLEQLQTIAEKNGNRRPVGTPGFQATIDYIETQLRSKTNFRIFKQEFRMNSTIFVTPVLISTISGIDKNYMF